MNQQRQEKTHEVFLTVGSRRVLVQDITKYTTCSDVIKMVLKKFPIRKTSGDSFGIFESSRGSDKPISGGNRLVKIMRSWGPASAREFVMKRINMMSKPIVSEAKRRKLTRCTTTEKAANCIDDNQKSGSKNVPVSMPHLYKTTSTQTFGIMPEKIDTTVSLPTTYSRCADRMRVPETCECCHGKRSRDVYDQSLPSTRNVTGRSFNVSHRSNSRKTPVVLTHTDEVKYAVRKSLKSEPTKRINTRRISTAVRRDNREVSQSTQIGPNRDRRISRSTTRTHDELAQQIAFQIDNMDQREGKEAILNRYFSDYIMFQSPSRPSMCRGRGDGAESEDVYNRRGDGDSYTCYSTKLHDNDVTMDTTCFSQEVDDVDVEASTKDVLNEAINGSCVEDSISDIDDVSGDSGHEDADFDVAFIDDQIGENQLVDYSLTESDLSDIPSDSVDNVITMGSVSDYVRSVFNDNMGGDEDDELDSFMITKHAEDITDEGLGSIESDEELFV